MLNVIIMDRDGARKYQFKTHEETSIIISITDVEKKRNQITPNLHNKIKSVLELKFDDVEKGWPNCITSDDAHKITNFVNAHKNNIDTIIVHCEAGISRSAGVAAAITKYLGGDDTPIFNSPQYCPNETCYQAVLAAFSEKEMDIDVR